MVSVSCGFAVFALLKVLPVALGLQGDLDDDFKELTA